MSKFEVCFSPPISRRQGASASHDETREPTNVILGPFTPKAVVSFLEVPVSKIARRLITITTRNGEGTTVNVVQKPKQDMSIEWETKQLPENGKLDMEIIWKPSAVGVFNEIIILSDHRGVRKDVKLVMKSISGKKSNIGPSRTAKLSKPLKSSPKRRTEIVNRAVVQQKASVMLPTNTAAWASSTPAATVTAPKTPLGERNFNATQIFQPDPNTLHTMFDKQPYEKENKSPQTPVPDPFRRFRFSPVTESVKKEKSCIEYLASLPTPTALRPSLKLAPRKDATTEDMLASMVTPKTIRKNVKIVDPPPSSGAADKWNSSSETYYVAEHSFEEHVVNNETRVISPHGGLSVIKEEETEYDITRIQSETFNLRSIQRDDKRKKVEEILLTPVSRKRVSLSSKELYKPSPSRPWQGSMPDLSNKKENNDIRSIENNRYFLQSVDADPDEKDCSIVSTESTAEPMFRVNEIKAMSSQFNLNEVGLLPPSSSCTNLTAAPSSSSESLVESTYKAHKSTSHLLQPGLMSFSPPKRGTDGFLAPAVPSHGPSKLNTWGATKPKKMYNYPTKLTLKATATPTAATEKQILYNPDIQLSVNVNPDPFSATMTVDPFLASTMYHDEEAIDRHEVRLKNWLNALVAIPPDLDSHKTKIDVGKLFTEVQNKKQVAESKEKVIGNFYKTRFDHLRMAAIRVYQNPDVVVVLAAIQPQIEGNHIQIKEDCDLQLQCGLQQQILDLLFCFNTLWLRLGLEVVTGEVVPMHSNSDLHALTRFIIDKIFRNEYIEQKYKKRQFDTRTYKMMCKKHNLKRIFCLLYFLDVAKESKMIKQNPCLFTRNSPFKETREILIRFSSLMLSKMGDITRHLKRFGYVLAHKQTYLDEFDYAFKNLGVDLRDGVRLTKVMENILLRDDLSSQLRVPAISRMQKVFNVDLALKALSDAEYEIKGDITARDIADGHREKTLSLLWQIIYKFRAPKFNQAATVIQQGWRKCRFRFRINRRIVERKEKRLHDAATKIQAAYKGFVVRRWFVEFKARRLHAIVQLQARIRGYLSRKRYNHARVTKSRTICATKIQSFYKMTQIRKSFVTLRTSTVIIQRFFRRYLVMKRQKEHFQATKAASVVIQQRIRGYFQMKRDRQSFLATKTAAITIQRRFRANQLATATRHEFLQYKSAVITVQTRFRALLSMRKQRLEYLRLRAAASLVQEHYRGLLAMRVERQRYVETRNAAVVLQRRFRANQVMKVERTNFVLLKLAAYSIQQHYRAQILMRRDRQTYLEIRAAVICIQRKFKAHRQMQKEFEEFQRLKTATVNVQRRFRANILAKKENLAYKRLRWAAVVFQRQYRAQLLKRQHQQSYDQLKLAAVKIQRFYRGYKRTQVLRSEFLAKRRVCIQIQRRYRATTAMRDQQAQYFRLKQAAIAIQRRFRAKLAARRDYTAYQQLNSAARTLQSHFRAKLAMKETRARYLEIRGAAVTLQRHWRARKRTQKAVAVYQKVQSSCRVIQQRFRATLLMRKQLVEYRHTVATIITVQRQFRAMYAMKRQRKEFLELRMAAVNIQTRFRANAEMKRTRAEFLVLKSSAINVQRRFRANLAMKREKAEFVELKNAVLTIQSHWRATQCRNLERSNYLSLRRAVVATQRRWRGKLATRERRTEFLSFQATVIYVQRKFRAKKAMLKCQSEFQALKSAAKTLQRQFRANKLMVQHRNQFTTLRRSVIVIQRRFRAKLAMVCVHTEFQNQRKAATLIQRHFRGYLLMRAARNEFSTKRRAAIVIQKRWTEYVVAKAQHAWYVKLQATTVRLQAMCRGYLARESFRAKMTPEMIEMRRQAKACTVIQAAWRGARVRKHLRGEQFTRIRKRLCAAQKNMTEQRKVKYQLEYVVNALKGSYRIETALELLRRLERLSRLAPYTLEPHARFISNFCYGLMAQAIRSEPDKQMIELCACIVLNMARYEPTSSIAFSESGLTTIAQMLLRWCDKECGIFITLCTLVWLFGRCSRKNQIIRKFMITPEAIFMLKETRKLTIRKENMRKTIKKPFGCHLTQLPTNIDPKQLPTLKPDYGIIRGRPYVFYSPSFALDTVLATLHVNV